MRRPAPHASRFMLHGIPRARGVTLIEMVVVIAITGFIAAAVAVFIRRPVEGYANAARRAELTDIADTALRRMTRDLRTALPNSVRVTLVGTVYYLEYLQTRTGGRYRTEVPSTVPASGASTCPDTDADTLANENVLQFGVDDTCLGTLGEIPERTAVATTDFLVVYNLGEGIANADAYASGPVTGGNKSLITAAVGAGAGGENVVRFATHAFTFPSPGRRFHIISGPVTYVCDPVNRTLRRVSGYAIDPTQPADITAAPLSLAPVNALLANNVGACTITYTIGGATGRTGVVALNLEISQSGETVRLFQQVHISNVP